MAISWPIWQAQLRGIIPTQRPPAFQTPDVANLLYKGISGFGDNIVAAGERAQSNAFKERELALAEEYKRGMLGNQASELALKKQQFDAYGKLGEQLQGLSGVYGAGGAAAPAGGPGRGGDASSSGPGLPSFVRSGGAMSNLDTGMRIYNKLVERNVDPKVAAGLVGNMGVESRFSSSALNPNDKGMPSFGLVQHRGDRARTLHANAARAGKPWHDEDVQVDTIVGELFGSENAAYQAALRAGSPAEAAAILAERYERPSKSALAKTLPERMSVAEAIGRGVPTSRTPGTPPPDAIAPPQAAPTRVASLNPSAGLVPPPMQGTPQPAPPLPPPAPPQRQQEQVMPGSPLFPTAPQGPVMQMPQQGPQAGLQLSAPEPAPPGPPPQQMAQAPAGAPAMGLPEGEAARRRRDPRLLAALGAALKTGDAAAIRAAEAAIGLVAPEPAYSVSDGFRVERSGGTIEPVPGMRQPGAGGGDELLLPPGDPRRPGFNIDPKDPRTYKVGVNAQGGRTIEPVSKADEREDKTPERLLSYSTAWEQNETVKGYRKMEDAVSGLQATLSQGNGISDMTAVIQLFKAIDPASTVSATETANAQTASGVDNRLWGFFNQLQGGGSLTPAARARMFNVARQILEERKSQAAQLTSGAQNRARAAGLDPELITGGWKPREFPRVGADAFPDREVDGSPRRPDAPRRPGESKATAIEVDSAEAAAGVDGWWRYKDPKTGKTVEGFNP